MVWRVGITLDQLGWHFGTRRIQSPDRFTDRMIDKYGQAFYDAWTPREQDRYATLRLREEAGIQYPRRPLAPRTAFLCSSSIALVVAAIAVSALSPRKPPKGLEDNLVTTSTGPTPPTEETNPPRDKKPTEPKQKKVENLKAPLEEPRPKSHEYFPSKPSKRSLVLIPDIKKTAGLLASHANRLYAEGDYALAAHGYEEIIQLGAATAATHNNLACCLFQVSSGDPSRAIEHFSYAIDYDPTNPSLYQNRGKVLSRQSRPKDKKAGIEDLVKGRALKNNSDENYQRPQDEPIDFVQPLHRYGRKPEPGLLRKTTGQPIDQVTPTSR